MASKNYVVINGRAYNTITGMVMDDIKIEKSERSQTEHSYFQPLPQFSRQLLFAPIVPHCSAYFPQSSISQQFCCEPRTAPKINKQQKPHLKKKEKKKERKEK